MSIALEVFVPRFTGKPEETVKNYRARVAKLIEDLTVAGANVGVDGAVTNNCNRFIVLPHRADVLKLEDIIRQSYPSSFVGLIDYETGETNE